MSKYFKVCLCTLCAMFLLFSGMFSLSADATSVDSGFVEYQVRASINFNEIIEVTLTEVNSGETYVHNLYRINDYTANFDVYFGTYSVSARVLSANSGDIFSGARATCITEEVVVKDNNLAVPVSLQIDQYVSGDVSQPQVQEDGTEVDLEGILESLYPEEPSGTEGTEGTEAMDSTEDVQIEETEESLVATSGRRSVITSLLFSLFLIGVGACVMWYFKNR